jgi:hypothetical protein
MTKDKNILLNLIVGKFLSNYSLFVCELVPNYKKLHSMFEIETAALHLDIYPQSDDEVSPWRTDP